MTVILRYHPWFMHFIYASGKMAQWLGVFAALAEDPSSVLSTMSRGLPLPVILVQGTWHLPLVSADIYTHVVYIHMDTHTCETCLWVHMCHGMHVRGRLCAADSLLPRFTLVWGANLGCQAYVTNAFLHWAIWPAIYKPELCSVLLIWGLDGMSYGFYCEIFQHVHPGHGFPALSDSEATGQNSQGTNTLSRGYSWEIEGSRKTFLHQATKWLWPMNAVTQMGDKQTDNPRQRALSSTGKLEGERRDMCKALRPYLLCIFAWSVRVFLTERWRACVFVCVCVYYVCDMCYRYVICLVCMVCV